MNASGYGIRDALHKIVVERAGLSADEARSVMRQLVAGDFTPAQFGALMTGWRMKGETPTELASIVEVVRDHGQTVDLAVAPRAVDLCGTGGDGPSAHVFNISTTTSLVAAGAGAQIAKHGTAAVSSDSGSSDVLRALGVLPSTTPSIARDCFEEVGITYMHAPAFNDGMRHLISHRRETGLRSIFNLVGPLSNPARVTRQLTGIYDRDYLTTTAAALATMGTVKAWVVHGRDGLDELSTTAPTDVVAVEDGQLRELVVDPIELGLSQAKLSALVGGTPAYNAAIVRAVVTGRGSLAQTEIVLLNAAAVLVMADIADDLGTGLTLAEQSVTSGAAKDVLDRWVDWSERRQVS